MVSDSPGKAEKTARQKAESLHAAGFTLDALVWAVLALVDAVERHPEKGRRRTR